MKITDKYQGHTKPPWAIVLSGDKDSFKIVDWRGKIIAGWTDRLRPVTAHEANARLLADAPDLLIHIEKLEEALQQIARLAHRPFAYPAWQVADDSRRIAEKALGVEENDVETDITELSEQEKSVMLARLRGWFVDGRGWIRTPEDTWFDNFYKPKYMALAKSAILWGYNFIPQFHQWLHKPGTALAILIGGPGFPHALDQMLKMAIENGLIEMKKEGGQ